MSSCTGCCVHLWSLMLCRDIDGDVTSFQSVTKGALFSMAGQTINLVARARDGPSATILPEVLPTQITQQYGVANKLTKALQAMGLRDVEYNAFMYPTDAVTKQVVLFLAQQLPGAHEADSGEAHGATGTEGASGLASITRGGVLRQLCEQMAVVTQWKAAGAYVPYVAGRVRVGGNSAVEGAEGDCDAGAGEQRAGPGGSARGDTMSVLVGLAETAAGHCGQRVAGKPQPANRAWMDATVHTATAPVSFVQRSAWDAARAVAGCGVYAAPAVALSDATVTSATRPLVAGGGVGRDTSLVGTFGSWRRVRSATVSGSDGTWIERPFITQASFARADVMRSVLRGVSEELSVRDYVARWKADTKRRRGEGEVARANGTPLKLGIDVDGALHAAEQVGDAYAQGSVMRGAAGQGVGTPGLDGASRFQLASEVAYGVSDVTGKGRGGGEKTEEDDDTTAGDENVEEMRKQEIEALEGRLENKMDRYAELRAAYEELQAEVERLLLELEKWRQDVSRNKTFCAKYRKPLSLVDNCDDKEEFSDAISAVQEQLDALRGEYDELLEAWQQEVDKLLMEIAVLEHEASRKTQAMLTAKEGVDALKDEYDALVALKSSKKREVKELRAAVGNLRAAGGNGREWYTNRIMEIVSHIRDQSKQIKEQLVEESGLQDSIARLSEQLDRAKNEADGLIQEGAQTTKRGAAGPRVLPLWTALRAAIDTVNTEIERGESLRKDCRVVESRCVVLEGERLEENLAGLRQDLKTMREEIAALRAAQEKETQLRERIRQQNEERAAAAAEGEGGLASSSSATKKKAKKKKKDKGGISSGEGATLVSEDPLQ